MGENGIALARLKHSQPRGKRPRFRFATAQSLALVLAAYWSSRPARSQKSRLDSKPY